MTYRLGVAALTLLCAVVALGLPTAGAEPQVGAKNNGLSICEERYLSLYDEAQAKFGSGAVGANLVDDGTGPYAPYELPDDLACSKADVLDGMLNPPPEPTTGTADVSTTSAPTETYSGGSYSIPESIVMCESGGDYSAVNPSSGAYGAYQILPSTSAAYGCDMSTPAGQDACAAEIYADSGGGAWVC